ncbi:hypothetical protein EYB45_03260 [Erythrobacteraceae bacterium CFH 75059]|nr:hypothetical protein EYB45_03260 [Erythrobacteraceae bacterium CFH 75059]
MRKLALAFFLLPVAGAAQAQDANTAVNIVYITEDEQCPPSTEEVITVCGLLEEQFRIPSALRQPGGPANRAWTDRVRELRTVGESGTLSCSPAGAGGFTGCTQELIAAAYRDRQNAPARRFGQIIEAARADRLATIDEAAAAEQARVEQIEREYEARLARERGEDPVTQDQPPAEPLPAPR